MPGLARGLPADGPARPVQLLRGVHPHHRLDVQPARQVAEGHRRHPVAPARSRASTTCCPATSGARTTTASATRTRASSTTSSTRRPTVVRVYLPPDANTLLSTYDHCLRSRQYVNVVVAGKQPAPNFLTMDQAIAHCTRGLGIWDWAGTEVPGEKPDVVLGCAGDVPDARGAGGGGHPARASCRTSRSASSTWSTSCACRTSGSTRTGCPTRVRRAVHDGQAGDLRVPRLPVAHPPAHLPPPRAHQHPRARLQGGGHDDDAVRHGHAQRPRPVPPGDRRHRQRAALALARRRTCARRWWTSGCGPASTPASTATTCPRSATGSGPTRRTQSGRGQVAATLSTGGDNE